MIHKPWFNFLRKQEVKDLSLMKYPLSEISFRNKLKYTLMQDDACVPSFASKITNPFSNLTTFTKITVSKN
jgi:hypothetical protein